MENLDSNFIMLDGTVFVLPQPGARQPPADRESAAEGDGIRSRAATSVRGQQEVGEGQRRACQGNG